MAGGPQLVSAPDRLYRVALAPNGLAFTYIDPVDAVMPRAGNRFDVPGGGVLYCCTQLEGCYRETLARLRPSVLASGLDEDSDNHYMRAGCVAASWRDSRRVFTISLENAAPFIDVEAQPTRSHLDEVLGSRLSDHLDISDVRGRDRILTRTIAEWAYGQLDQDGMGMYSGIRYMSRLGDYECWAVFDGAPIAEAGPPASIELSDPELNRVAHDFHLTLN